MANLKITCFNCGRTFQRSAYTLQSSEYVTCPYCGRRVRVIGGRETAKVAIHHERQMRQLNQQVRRFNQRMRALRSKLR